jgi:hypothetical protein
MSLSRARTLEEIATTCTPEPLRGEALKVFFVETAKARDEKSDLRKRLVSIFNKDNVPKRVLVYGHRGCGKSTELSHFKGEVGGQWLIVDFSVQMYLPPVGLTAEDVLLAISVAMVDQLDKAGAPTNGRHLKRIESFFDEIARTETKSRDAKLDTEAGVGVGGSSLWKHVLDLKAKLSSELSFGSRIEQSQVHKIRQRPGDLIAAVNNLINAVEEILTERGKHLLLIVEDLDKIQLAEAYDIFVQNNLLLSKLNANVIYTIPIFTFYTADADVIRAHFDDDVHLQMIKVFNRDGSPASGYAKVKEIILKRVDKAMIDEDAIDLLVRGTGGVLRHVFEALQHVSSFSNIHDNHIRKQNIRDALNKVRADLGIMIGWPRKEDGSQDKPDDLFKTLAEAAK